MFEERPPGDEGGASARGLTRRGLLVASGQGALALGGAGLLAGCGGGSATGLTAPATGGDLSAGGGTPVRGGTFTVGIVGAGGSENLYPGSVNGVADYFRIQQLYDNLFNVSTDAKLSLTPALALSAEPNADATTWTFELRDGVHWHDGKPFTADDVVYTFNRAWASPANYANASLARFVDFGKVRKRDRLTVEVPLVRPAAQFPTLFTFLSANTWIVPDGSTPAELARRPNGTGPFKFVSFTPGKRSVFEANREYWEHGKPYVDRLEVDSSFASDTALVNALLSGQINVLTPLPYAQARRYLNSPQIKVLRGPGHTGSFVYMRVDQGPFADVRIRQAMKLAVDRKLLIDNVLSGFGEIGIDFSPGGNPDIEYGAKGLEPEHDPERARALVKAAGREGMTAVFETSAITDTFQPAATLIAQQAKAAGIDLRVKVVPTSTYYTPASGFRGRYLGQDVGSSSSSMTSAYMGVILGDNPYNETHWGEQPGGRAADKLLLDAVAATEPAKAERLWHRVQQLQVEQGGYLIWGYGDALDAAAPHVRGLRESPSFNLNNFRMLDGWLAE